MSWETVQLGDIIQTLKGYAFKSGHYAEYGVPIVRASNFTMDSISNDDLKFYTENEASQFRKYELSTGNVLIQTVGSWESNPASVVGKVVRVPQLLNGALLNQNIVKVFPADKDQLDLQYLFYRLRCHDFKRHNIGNAVGAANQASITLETIRAFTFQLPSLSAQERIAKILKGYDDLIENNQKQIKLLEEAAQRLYKEWFVDLRFPGHETTPIVDGVPEGWSMTALSKIASVNKQSIPKQYPYDYVDYIDIGSVSKGRIESTTRFTITEAPGRAKRIAFDGDILWGMVRPNLKSYALVFHPTATSVFSTGFAVLHAEKVPFSFLYCHVTQDDFVGYLVNCTNGAAYPAVKPVHFEKAILLLPTDEILDRFHALVCPMFRKVEILEREIQQATEARDRLLPKLMNGEIEV